MGEHPNDRPGGTTAEEYWLPRIHRKLKGVQIAVWMLVGLYGLALAGSGFVILLALIGASA